MNESLIITVKEARKLLGKEAQGMNDEEVLGIIIVLTAAAKSFLKKKSVKESNSNLGL